MMHDDDMDKTRYLQCCMGLCKTYARNNCGLLSSNAESDGLYDCNASERIIFSTKRRLGWKEFRL